MKHSVAFPNTVLWNFTFLCWEIPIIALVREQPSQHDILSLYAQLRPEGWPVKMVERATRDLLKARILSWDGRTVPPKLTLNEFQENPFLQMPTQAPMTGEKVSATNQG